MTTEKKSEVISSNLKHLKDAILHSDEQKFTHYFPKIKPQEINSDIKMFVAGSKKTFQTRIFDLAVAFSHENFALKLLTLKPTINFQQADNRYTALHYAAQNGLYEVVVALVKNGANLNLRDFEQRFPLSLAAKNVKRKDDNDPHFKIVKYLCEQKDVDLDIAFKELEEFNNTPFALIILVNKFPHVILYLLEQVKKRASAEIYKHVLEFSLSFSSRHKREATTAALEAIAKPFPGLLITQNQKMLLQAEKYIFNNQPHDLEKLIAAGLNPNSFIVIDSSLMTCDTSNMTFDSHSSEINNSTKIVRNATLIYIASYLNNENIVRLLLAKGADPTINSSSEQDAVFIAAIKCHFTIVELLISSSKVDLRKMFPLLTYDHITHRTYNSRKINLLSLLITHLEQTTALSPLFKLIKHLIKKGINPGETSEGAPSPLYEALSVIARRYHIHRRDNSSELKDIICYIINTAQVETDSRSSIITQAITTNDAVILFAVFKKFNVKDLLKQDEKDILLKIAYLYELPVSAELLINAGADVSCICPDNPDLTIGEWVISKKTAVINPTLKVVSNASQNQTMFISAEVIEKTSSSNGSAFSLSTCSPAQQHVIVSDTLELTMSRHRYLKEELRLSKKQITALDELCRPSKTRRSSSHFFATSNAEPACTWMQGAITKEHVKVVRKSINCYYYFLTLFISRQINDEAKHLLEVFKQVEPRFDDDHIKLLSGCQYTFNVNGAEVRVKHELKIHASPARILVASAYADKGKARLFFPILFLENGLHQTSDKKALDTLSKDFIIDWAAEIDKQDKSYENIHTRPAT